MLDFKSMLGIISICKVRMRGLLSLRVLLFTLGVGLVIKDIRYLIEWEILEVVGVPLCIVILID
jgi:hypothetical protein